MDYSAEAMRALPDRERRALLSSLTDDEAVTLHYDWDFWARDAQRAPPGDWFVWMLLSGRGFGKTRSAVEWVRTYVEGNSPQQAPAGAPERIALVAETAADARDVMIEGPSGILKCSPPGYGPLYEPSKRRLTWQNGIIATTYSAEDPDQLRGPEHGLGWADELAKWKYAADTWSNLVLGMRQGTPKIAITTTPRPLKLIKELVLRKTTVITRGSTYENRANLSGDFLREIEDLYEGTRIGGQEIHGRILDDVEGALWLRTDIDKGRVKFKDMPAFERIVVAVDPPVTSNADSDECGIVVVGRCEDGDLWVIADLSVQGRSPTGWAEVVVKAYEDYEADRVIGEVNNGGEMIETVIRTVGKQISYKAVRATRGKMVRAEPVAARYEKGEVHHVGMFEKMEDQMCSYTGDRRQQSPDRMDALVWGCTELTQRSQLRIRSL